MAIIVDMPRLSDTMEEGTIASWLKEVGDKVKAGEGLAEIETDKAVMVFESFDDGVLLVRLLDAGATVPLGTPIAILGKEGEDVSALEKEARERIDKASASAPEPEAKAEPEEEPEAEAEKEEPEAEAEEPAGEKEPEAEAAPKKAPAPAPKKAPAPARKPKPGPDLSAPTDEQGQRIAASPLARRVAQERGLDLASIAGSGPRGRIVVADLENAAPLRKLSTRLGARPRREDELVRVTQMRKTIAKRLTASKQESPHYYLTIEVDAGRLVALRGDVNEALALATPEGEKPPKISYNDMVMRACVVALARHPNVNAGWEGANIRRFGGVHLGFAVALPDGLITPVVHDADQLDLFALSDRTKELAARAREGELEGHEYAGNSFCVSNLGMFGIDHFTAVINPPAACILAVGALVEAPLVKGGALVAGHRMTLTLSCDHRVVDGATGAAFMADLRKVLEAPSALIL